MAHPSESGRTRGQLGALVIGRLLREPGQWSARALAVELGEATPRRVQRIVAELEEAGWTVERAKSRGIPGTGQEITLTP
ncbi:hypothetical protein [uncultured Deinococcus sp.]|uniref:hypothetical protein n=1 Tax=uncultured Deinococcus sp. TaxID=158789 RepID=UPI0025882369|nr:hypothetical protein [uncultured Deinococcus sp.]